MEYPSYYDNIPQTFELIKDTVAHPENLLENTIKAIELSYNTEPDGLRHFIINCSGPQLENVCLHFHNTKNWKYLVEMIRYYHKFTNGEWVEDIEFIRAFVESDKRNCAPLQIGDLLEWFEDFDTPLDQFIPFIRLLIAKGKMGIIDSFIRDLVKKSAQSEDNNRTMALLQMAVSAGYDYNFWRDEYIGLTSKKVKENLLKFAIRQGAFDVCDFLVDLSSMEVDKSFAKIIENKIERYQKIKDEVDRTLRYKKTNQV